MSHDLALALLRSIVDAQELFLDAAELVSLGAITPERYQSAADRFHDSIDAAAGYLPPTVETGELEAAYAEIGADAEIDCENFRTLTAEELRDELVYLADFQG